MWFGKKRLILCLLGYLLFDGIGIIHCQAWIRRHRFVVMKEAPYTRLCSTKKILTVNGKFPRPTLYAHKEETLIVDVYNRGKYNITIHCGSFVSKIHVSCPLFEREILSISWHGVEMPRYPWSDGPDYITQYAIKPGGKFSQKVIFSTEEGTLWWHAHSDWSRATVHGAIIVYPKHGTVYPFPRPYAEVPIILGEWWKQDVIKVLEEFVRIGGTPNDSDAFINGQPGDLYPCSKPGTFKLTVEHGKTYLLRIMNAAMNEILFLAIAKHKLTVVGADASYTKPLKAKYITISPGQTIDALFHANCHHGRYYIAARAYSAATSPPLFPHLPYRNDTRAKVNFTGSLRSLGSKNHPINVPLKITTPMISTVSLNTLPCHPNRTCLGPNGIRLAASMNNLSWVNPSIDILQAYYYHIKDVFGDRFLNFPPYVFNVTPDYFPMELEIPKKTIQVKILKYNSTVEVVFQGTNLVAGIDHPMHLHGHSFYVVGWGFGNHDKFKDPLTYNLVDPPLLNTVDVPRNGWITIRFKASNPG
ncbi:unnamed protein product [Camellia sinensis]